MRAQVYPSRFEDLESRSERRSRGRMEWRRQKREKKREKEEFVDGAGNGPF